VLGKDLVDRGSIRPGDANIDVTNRDIEPVQGEHHAATYAVVELVVVELRSDVDKR
jgi:hypothetical protein